jgi:voltage-gated potassium channel
MLLSKSLTPLRAARIIVVLTFVTTIAAGVLIWLVDHGEFPSLGTSLWWALQTVTTVGYGDVVPAQTGGRIIGSVVMLQGIGFITVVAASVTAVLIEQMRGRPQDEESAGTAGQLDRIESRLASIERALNSSQQSTDPPQA